MGLLTPVRRCPLQRRRHGLLELFLRKGLREDLRGIEVRKPAMVGPTGDVEHAHVGLDGPQSFRELGAGRTLEQQVRDENVDARRARVLERLASVRSYQHEREPRAQHAADDVADGRVVFHEEDGWAAINVHVS
jgi:hypothetical protein